MSTDSVMPTGPWGFDEEVAGCFEDMLRRSIPQYDVMRDAVTWLGQRFASGAADTVVDLGTSRGDALVPFVDAGCYCVGVEVSGPMLELARQRFEDEGEQVELLDLDLRAEYPAVTNVDLTLAVLTLQFVPVEHRFRVVRKAFESLRPGGALILVEKVLGASSEIDEAMVDLYYRHKRTTGYTAEQIERKRLSLEGVLVPLTESWNVDMLRSAGFETVECFWRWMVFAGWIAIKGSAA